MTEFDGERSNGQLAQLARLAALEKENAELRATALADRAAQRSALEALVASEQRLRRAQEAGGVGVFTIDLIDNRLRATPELCRIFGIPVLDSMPAELIERLVVPEDGDAISHTENRRVADIKLHTEYRIRRADNGEERCIARWAEFERDETGKPVKLLGVLQDVTERRAARRALEQTAAELKWLNQNLEREVAERTAALQQSQKMEAVGQLTGGLAHDFNNLLVGITASLELMQLRVRQGRTGELDRYVQAAQSSARRAASLTHRLLAFSRRQTLDPKPTGVDKLVQGMEELIRRTVGPNITVEVVTSIGAWSALVDPPQLENALLNLCINARDAMPDGGRLTIETANRTFDERIAREHEVRAGQYLSLSVSDTGTGMSPEVAQHAFEPFFTTKPIGLGTGLGLSMVYGFAQQSGGQVRVYSELGHGTTMSIFLPRHDGPSAADDPVPASDAAPLPTGATALVIDDEVTVRAVVVEVMQELGYATVEAADGPSGMNVLASNARIDLLITDVGLPGGMNGRQVADAARALRPELKVLFITGYAENAAIGKGRLGPGMQVLTKPFTIDTLSRRIRELVL